MKTNFNKKLRYIFFLLFIFVVFLIIIEFVFRITHCFRAKLLVTVPDTLISCRFKPNTSFWFYKENDHPIIHNINNYGWNDVEWDIKDDRKYKIAILGDSFVESFDVEKEKSFLDLTENELNKTYKDINFELMNFGMSGFTQTEEYIILYKDVLQFKPDLIVLFFLPDNDIADIRRETTSLTNRPFFVHNNNLLVLDNSFYKSFRFKIKKLINPIKINSVLCSFIIERIYLWQKLANRKKWKNSYLKQQNNEILINGYQSLCVNNKNKEFKKSYSLCKFLLSAIIKVVKSNDIKMMLVCIDNDSYIPDEENKFKEIDDSYNPFFFDEDLGNFADSLDIYFIGLQKIFRDNYLINQKKLHWAHWNYEGHKLVSSELSKKIKQILEELDE
jgi:hypothetical protein